MSVAARLDYDTGPATEPDWTWIDVCAVGAIPIDCGVAALVDGRQIALVRTAAPAPDVGRNSAEQRVYALSNYDPFSEAFVIARGIVGDRGGIPKIASPLFKQTFDLRTGVCFEDPSVRLPTYPVRVRDGRVEVGVEADAARRGVAR